MGLLNKASSTIENKQTGGLFSKITKMKASAPSIDFAGKSTLETNSDQFIEEVTSSRNGMAVAASTFDAYRKQLRFEKGSLLLFDFERDVFFPWASYGLDQTTLHRLRLTMEDIHELFSEGIDSPVLFSTDIPGTLKPYFSLREFLHMNNVYMYPFTNDNKPVGILLVCNLPDDDNCVHTVYEFMNKTAPHVESLLFDNRETMLERLSSMYKEPHRDLDTEMNEFISVLKENKEHAMFILGSFGEVIDRIAKTAGSADRYSIKSDILKITESLAGLHGRAVEARGDAILIMLRGNSLPDPELLFAQINFGITRLFTGLPDDLRIPLKTKMYPQDNPEADILVYELIDKI